MKKQYRRTIIYICFVILVLSCVSCSNRSSEQLPPSSVIGSDVDSTTQQPPSSSDIGSDVDNTTQQPPSSPVTGSDVDSTVEQPPSSPPTGSGVDKPIEQPTPPSITDTDDDVPKPGGTLPLDTVPLDELWYWYSLMDETHKENYMELYDAIMAWLTAENSPADLANEFRYEMTAARFTLEDYLIVALNIKEDNPLIKAILSLGGDEAGGRVNFIEALRYPYDDIVLMSRDIVSASGELLSGLTTDMNDYEKYRYIAETLCLRVSYDYVSFGHYVNSTGSLMDDDAYKKMQWSQSAYGAIVRKTAICEGFAYAYQYLCNRAGLWCISVGGSSSSGAHQWNMIVIDGGYYWVDVTWMLACGERYFCLTDEQLLIDHNLPNYTNMPIPSTFFTCDATEYAYMGGKTGSLY